MKIWTFIFTSPTAELESCRVTAPTQKLATVFVLAVLGAKALPPRTIINYAGEREAESIDFIQMIPREPVDEVTDGGRVGIPE